MLKSDILLGDCREILPTLAENSISACLTDPPYNYEFIGHQWNTPEIKRRLERSKKSTTLVKNIPYGSGLAGAFVTSAGMSASVPIFLIIKNGAFSGLCRCTV